VVATVYEAGYIGDDPVAHATRRSLNGYRALCGEKPDRVVGRFDTTDEQACSSCLAVVSPG
jgi:hypothetical protein